MFQVEGSRLVAGEQGEHSGTRGHSQSFEAITSSVRPKKKAVSVIE